MKVHLPHAAWHLQEKAPSVVGPRCRLVGGVGGPHVRQEYSFRGSLRTGVVPGGVGMVAAEAAALCLHCVVLEDDCGMVGVEV